MAIELKQGDYFLGTWTLHGQTRNWMAIIVKRDGKWLIQYRFRYFKDDKIGEDSEDERSFYAASCDGDTPEEQIIQNVEFMMSMLKTTGFGANEETVIMRTSNMDEALAKMSGLPSVTTYTMPCDGTPEHN